MITIHKFPVKVTELFKQVMPEGAKFLHVQDQGLNGPQMWFKVDTTKRDRVYDFGVFGTGHDMEKGPDETVNRMSAAPHLGTFSMHGGALVFHLFGGIYA